MSKFSWKVAGKASVVGAAVFVGAYGLSCIFGESSKEKVLEYAKEALKAVAGKYSNS